MYIIRQTNQATTTQATMGKHTKKLPKAIAKTHVKTHNIGGKKISPHVPPVVITANQPAAGNCVAPQQPPISTMTISSSTPTVTPVEPPSQTQSKSCIEKYLGGTSDHSWKTYQFSLSSGDNKENSTIKVGTWNLMDRCFAPQGGISNNPLNHNEQDVDYLVRKYVQITEISKLIEGGKSGKVKNLDSLVFQEVDFWAIGVKAKWKMSKGQAIQDWEKPYVMIYEAFEKMVKKCGWEMITTRPSLTKNLQDPLIIIYNPQVLKPNSQYLEGCFAQPHHNGSTQFRGAQTVFTHAVSGRDIAMANLHFNYSYAPQKDIEDYQEQQMNKHLPTIALGDLNRTPNKALSSSIADWNYPTNVDAETVADRGNPGKLTVKDSGSPNLNKAYDAALANPGDAGERVVVTETEMAYFSKNQHAPGFQLSYVDLNRSHTSQPGRPWKRGNNDPDQFNTKTRRYEDTKKNLAVIEAFLNISVPLFLCVESLFRLMDNRMRTRARA